MPRLYGRLKRSQLAAEHVRKARATWTSDEYTPKTINNRVQTLKHLYHVLDGRPAPTPADDVTPLPVPESPKVLVNAKVLRSVAANLADAKTTARFMLIASTGVRPAEVKRAEPGDVDLGRRVWFVRTAKGGAPRTFWLNDDMKAATDSDEDETGSLTSRIRRWMALLQNQDGAVSVPMMTGCGRRPSHARLARKNQVRADGGRRSIRAPDRWKRGGTAPWQTKQWS